ncbi:anti-Muellerian hormone type-2 receptor isoform X2 [Rhinatrema bivittatum]|uniref:anti-Muellerian hormone type-2 receptor isoform X2 n=1 Tax=Rhinatrema bivittatum TaxID=194408 RepID=UPI0011277287|nr:anti-Muellerian hormone type-2 receptor isoform X2 [Rhinatrema bivittatum]
MGRRERGEKKRGEKHQEKSWEQDKKQPQTDKDRESNSEGRKRGLREREQQCSPCSRHQTIGEKRWTYCTSMPPVPWTRVSALLAMLPGAPIPEPRRGPVTCAFYQGPDIKQDFPSQGDLVNSSRIRCKENMCCYGIWLEASGERHPQTQGCWEDKAIRCDANCEALLQPISSNSSLYKCLCRSDMCNANISRTLPTLHHPQTTLLWWLRARVMPRREETLELEEVAPSFNYVSVKHPPREDLRDLQFTQVLKVSPTAVLWRGILRGEDVVIKSFPACGSAQYMNEWQVLSTMLPVPHENVVCFLAAGSAGLGKERLLVSRFYPAGSLRHYLTHHTSDWYVTMRLALSVARGLEFLHEEVWRDGCYKAGIAHRDLSSENVLVKDDGTCVISDFGLAMLLQRHQEGKAGEQDSAVITMTGTLRYMSPEMQDGSMNLRSWEWALRQADVYSLGLLLWETFSRCNSLYPDSVVPDFQLAFEAELGSEPTFSMLRELVFEKRRRPKFPEPWKQKSQIYSLLKETLESCWDHDPDGRLSASCTERRLQQLMGCGTS